MKLYRVEAFSVLASAARRSWRRSASSSIRRSRPASTSATSTLQSKASSPNERPNTLPNPLDPRQHGRDLPQRSARRDPPGRRTRTASGIRARDGHHA
jgi:hypothetical protein